MNLPRLEALIDRYFDGELSAGELQELSALLEAESTARDCYWRRAKIHGALCRWGVAQAGIRQFAAAGAGSPDKAVPAIILPEPAPPATAKRAPVLGFLGGALDYVNQSRTLMFWLIVAAGE